MNDTPTPATRSRGAWWYVFLLAMVPITVGVALFRFEPSGVITRRGMIGFGYRTRVDDALLQRALALPPGTPKATVDATLGDNRGWGNYGAKGYEGAYYPESSFGKGVFLYSYPPFFGTGRGLGSDAKAVIVHFDSSVRLSHVEPTTRRWPD